jgi:hypothetical protein
MADVDLGANEFTFTGYGRGSLTFLKPPAPALSIPARRADGWTTGDRRGREPSVARRSP